MVDRYEPAVREMDNGGMEQYPGGAFVKYEDYVRMTTMLAEALQNYHAILDCPLGRRLFDTPFATEARECARNALTAAWQKDS
jgi:hypothetical protein